MTTRVRSIHHFVPVPGWDAILPVAMARAPEIPAWAWDQAARSCPLLTAPLSPRIMVALARVMVAHGTPPVVPDEAAPRPLELVAVAPRREKPARNGANRK